MKTQSHKLIFLSLLLMAIFTGCKKASELPMLSTLDVSDITNTSAKCGGNITDDGGSLVTQRGICWNESPNPTIDNFKSYDGSTGIGTFISTLGNLTGNKTYYVRAYATNSIGTVYGDEKMFTTGIGIGDDYEGGTIAYIFQPGDPGYIQNEMHGLIMAPANQSYGCAWGCIMTHINTSFDLGKGQDNTDLIINTCPELSIAARICNDFSNAGYSDWYLPSKYELDKISNNPILISHFANGKQYWCSSETGNTAQYAAVMQISNGTTSWLIENKDANFPFVKAFRTF